MICTCFWGLWLGFCSYCFASWMFAFRIDLDETIRLRESNRIAVAYLVGKSFRWRLLFSRTAIGWPSVSACSATSVVCNCPYCDTGFAYSCCNLALWARLCCLGGVTSSVIWRVNCPEIYCPFAIFEKYCKWAAMLILCPFWPCQCYRAHVRLPGFQFHEA